jgi:hypothetical protein
MHFLQQYKKLGVGVHEQEYDILTGYSRQFFAAAPLRNAVVIMLQGHDRADIKEAMAVYDEEIMPISCLIIPSTMVFYLQIPFNALLIFFCLQMEAELQFQMGGGTGHRFFPEGAETNLLKGEFEAMPS